MKMLKKTNIKLLLFSAFYCISCENSSLVRQDYIDPQIIFSSRRWWNYDIFIHDIYASQSTQLTKNKWIDFNPAISPDAKTLLFVSDRDGNREIYSMNLEWLDGYSQWRGNNLTNLTRSKENDWTPRFSPTQDKIIFSTYFPKNDNYDIFIMNNDGTEKENLTNTTSYEKYPQFSPDGSFIIFQGWNKTKMDIFFLSLVDKNIINITNNLKSNDIISHGNAISPDGQSIVFTSEMDGIKNIYITKIYESKPIKLTSGEFNNYEPAFSPDGQYIVFTSERDRNKEIYIMEVSSGIAKNLTTNSGDDWNPRFYPDNEKIIFQSTRDGNWEIYSMKIDGSNQTNLTNHPSTDYSYIVLPLRNP